MGALLDINVLISLVDWNHEFHQRARRWIRENHQFGWATCPITQNGFLRILSSPQYQDAAGHSAQVSPNRVAGWLRQLISSPHHVFLPDDISVCDDGVLATDMLITYRQITDLYLVALATRHAMKFVTFDRRIAYSDTTQDQSHNIEILGRPETI